MFARKQTNKKQQANPWYVACQQNAMNLHMRSFLVIMRFICRFIYLFIFNFSQLLASTLDLTTYGMHNMKNKNKEDSILLLNWWQAGIFGIYASKFEVFQNHLTWLFRQLAAVWLQWMLSLNSSQDMAAEIVFFIIAINYSGRHHVRILNGRITTKMCSCLNWWNSNLGGEANKTNKQKTGTAIILFCS